MPKKSKRPAGITLLAVIYVIAAFFLPVVADPSNILTLLEKLPNLLVSIIPGAIIGDVAGTVISKITNQL